MEHLIFVEDRHRPAPARGRRRTAEANVVCQRSPKVLVRRVGDDLIVSSPVGDPFVISGTGRVIWDMLVAPRTTSQIVQELSKTYDASSEDVESTVAPFLEELVARGLVEIRGPGG